MLALAATARPRPKRIFKNQKDQAFLDVFSLEEEHDQLFVSRQDKKGPYNHKILELLRGLSDSPTQPPQPTACQWQSQDQSLDL